MNKTILITGSTDGIGKLAALKLAKKGHCIYVHGRSEAKLATVISELKEASNNQTIKGFVADFSDLDAVSSMAAQINTEIPQLDILINNAGIYNSKKSVNKNGLDIRIVVNYLAPYVLTNALLPTLKKAAAPRIINLSSAAQASVSEAVLKGEQQVADNEAYAQSKLALTMWSFYLAKQEPTVNVVAVNPGSLLNTKMVQEAFGQHWAPAAKGVDILYDLALTETHASTSGKYFDNDQGHFASAHADAYDERLISELIEKTEQLIR